MTHFVSLGGRCAVAYNLRRHYRFSRAYPFDWWISTPGSVAGFLADPDLDLLYHPDNLRLADYGRTVADAHWGFLLHHEFPRDWTRPGQPIRHGWQNHTEQPKGRTAALTRKLLALNRPANRIAFVCETALDTSPLVPILGRLFDACAYALIVLPMQRRADDFEWKGDPGVWDATLAALRLAPANPESGTLEFDPERDSRTVGCPYPAEPPLD